MSEKNVTGQRPLSPHLQVYRLPYNAIMSITGRGVGMGLSIVVMALLAWFIAIVWNPTLYDQTLVLLDHPLTFYAGLALAFATFFYLGNGVRHVLWDLGVGVDEKPGIVSGNIVLLLSILLTLGLAQLTCGCLQDIGASQVQEEGVNNEQ